MVEPAQENQIKKKKEMSPALRKQLHILLEIKNKSTALTDLFFFLSLLKKIF